MDTSFAQACPASGLVHGQWCGIGARIIEAWEVIQEEPTPTAKMVRDIVRVVAVAIAAETE